MARTTLDLDATLISAAIRESGLATKKAAIEEAIREYVNLRRRERLLERIRGGDLGINLTREELRKMRGCE